MKFRFHWFNARKSLFFASFIDFSLYIIFFLNTFNNSISNKSLLIFLLFINDFIWIISSYITGKYSYKKKERIYFFINPFFKTILNIFINIVFSQLLFRIFWNWNDMNFESFSNFLNDFSNFYLKIFFTTISKLFYKLSFI